MNDVVLTLRQIRYEQRAFWRNPAAAFFTVGFPIMFLLIFNLLFGNETYEGFGKEVSGSTFYIPAIAALSLISACYTNIAISITFSRDEGVLKRVRGSPLPAFAYMVGRIGSASLIGIVMVAVVTAAGIVFYDVEVITEKIPALVVSVIVGAATFCALGLAITAAIPNADAAPPLVNFTILPLLFVSDVFIPLEDAPSWLTTVAGLFPVKHLADAMRETFDPFEAGSGFQWGDLAGLVIWGVLGAVIAARYFSWEPRR